MREISIQRFTYEHLIGKRTFVLIVGSNGEKRRSLAYSIAKGMYENTKPEEIGGSVGNLFDNSVLFIDACTEDTVEDLATNYDYVILMKGIVDSGNLKEIWSFTNCKPSISSFKMFNLIYTDCTKNGDVVVINAKSDTPVLSKKLFFSDYTEDAIINVPSNEGKGVNTTPPIPPPLPAKMPKPTIKPTEGGVTVGGKFYKLPAKISHLDETDDEEEVVINKVDNHFCVIL